MKKKLVRMFLTIAVAAITLVGATACALPGAETGGKAENESTEGSASETGGESDSLAEEGSKNAAEDVVEDNPLGIVVDFAHTYEESFETAVITATDANGKEIWKYETGKYEVAQLDRVEEIGISRNKFYFNEDGTITAMNLEDGSVAWKNDEFKSGGCRGTFGKEGNLYVCGYFGPDLMVIDEEGNTVLHKGNLDESKHYWPLGITVEDDYVFVHYEAYDDWNFSAETKELWNSGFYGGYTLSYCLSDESIGFEYNVLEQAPRYNGKYTDWNGFTAEIFYMNDGKYLMNLGIADKALVELEGVVGSLKDGAIAFEASYENGYCYKGDLVMGDTGLTLTIHESDNPYLSAGTSVTYTNREEVMANAGDNVFYTFPEGWNYEFEAARIGNFYTGQEAGVVADDAGNLYGFEEWLGAGCSTWCGVDHYYANAVASSTLEPSGDISYAASNIASKFSDKNTVWVEGADGDGIGEYVTVRQMYKGQGEELFTFKEICIVNGYAQNETKWQENNRVKKMKLYYNNAYMGSFTLEDTMKPQYIDISELNMQVVNGTEAEFRFEIEEVYEGSKYDDTCITGIVVEFDGRTAH